MQKNTALRDCFRFLTEFLAVFHYRTLMTNNIIFAIVFLWASVAIQRQAPQSPQMLIRPPQGVVEEYTKLGNDGSLLTSAGWDRAQAFFLHHVQPPEPIYVTDKHAAKLHWMKENKAEVDQEYVPIGQIDSSLRFTPPPRTRYGKLSIAYKLTLSDKRWETGVNGKESEVTSPTAWRIENSQTRWASLEAAIQYTERMSAKTRNNIIQQNAARTVARLKRYLSRKQAASLR